MKPKISVTLLILFILSSGQLSSQILAGLTTGIKHGNLIDEATFDFFESDLAYSVGLTLREETNINLFFNASLQVGNVGWIRKNDTGNVDEIYLKGNAISAAVDIGYYLINLDKFKLGLAAGLKLGTAYNSTFDYYPKPPLTVIFGTANGFVTFDSKLDLCYKPIDQLMICISPNYSILLKEDHSFRDVGLQASIYYTPIKHYLR